MPPRLLLAGLSLALWLVGCAGPTPPPAPTLLRVRVDDLTAPLLGDIAGPYGAVAPNVVLQPTESAADLSLTVEPAPDQFATPVGYITFTLIIHPTNPLLTLSLPQAQALFNGQLTNWDAVGGPAGQPIQTFSREPEAPATRFIQRQLWQGTAPKAQTTIAPTWPAMTEAVGQNPNALGYVPTFALTATVKPVAVEANLQLLVVAQTPTDPTGPTRALIAWLQSATGQAVVAQHYAPYK